MIDLTLKIKRAIFMTGFATAHKPLGRAIGRVLLGSARPGVALQAGESLVTRPWRVLALTAHPDDLEFFAGGTIRRMVLSGSHITAAVLTDGEKRGNRYGLASIRQQEQEAAARLQGIQDLRFCHLTDFGLPEDPRLEPTVARLWDEVQPEVVLAFDPKELLPGLANRDHKALGRTVSDLARHHLGRCSVYFYGSHHANVLVNIGAVMEAKEAAVLTHQSQMIYLSDEGYRAAVRLLAELSAAGAPCRYAEPLYRLT